MYVLPFLLLLFQSFHEQGLETPGSDHYKKDPVADGMVISTLANDSSAAAFAHLGWYLIVWLKNCPVIELPWVALKNLSAYLEIFSLYTCT